MSKDILMPIYKIWADQIFAGNKPFEFRKIIGTHFQIGSKIYIYESKRFGGCGKIVGEVTIESIDSLDESFIPDLLYFFWSEHIFTPDNPKESCLDWLHSIGFCDIAGNTPYKYAIKLCNPIHYAKAKELAEYVGTNGNAIIRAPQSWCYVN